MTQKILVSGASGFVGKQVVRDLLGRDVELYLLVRNGKRDFGFPLSENIHLIEHTSIEQYSGEGLPEKIDIVIHLVAIAHVTNNESLRCEYDKVNVKGTEVICDLAVRKKAKHFIYLSTVNVYGSETYEYGFSENDIEQPKGIYAETKYQAELHVRKLKGKGVKASIIRSPLVYGKGVKANMAALVKFVKVFPLIPFGVIHNRRSFISVRNLSHFIMTLIFEKPRIDYDVEIFLVSDNEPVSTAKLCQVIALALNRKVFILKLPQCCLKLMLTIVGKSSQWKKLTGNMEVNAKNPQKFFGWSAPYAMVDELKFLTKENH